MSFLTFDIYQTESQEIGAPTKTLLYSDVSGRIESRKKDLVDKSINESVVLFYTFFPDTILSFTGTNILFIDSSDSTKTYTYESSEGFDCHQEINLRGNL